MGKQVLRKTCFSSYDIDRKRQGRPGAYLRYMQETGMYQMAEDTPTDEELREQGKAFMVTRMDLKIHEPVLQDEEVITKSWACPSERATFIRDYAITKGDKLLAEATSQWALVDLNSRRILRVKDVDMSNYYMEADRPLFDEKLKIEDDITEKMKFVDERKVYFSNTDRNGHMNNTYSIDMFCDYIEDWVTGEKSIDYLRVHFANEAVLGEKIEIYMHREGDRCRFRSQLADGRLNVEAEIKLI